MFLASASVLAIDLSNEPMETAITPPPANIMFVYDNSGSMTFEFATNQTDGMWWLTTNWYWFRRETGYAFLYRTEDEESKYYYIYPNYSVLDGVNRNYWKTQWFSQNHIYYNPNQTYLPWPGKNSITVSEIKKVRANPQKTAPVVDLTETYTKIGNVVIPIIHYYVTDQTTPYLVNFNNTPKGWSRSYYRVNDKNYNEMVDEGELLLLTEAQIPDAAKAKRVQANGTIVAMSAEEEVLNFANWFGYHRNRSMAAKYAVSAALGELSNVNVGFYTINDNRDKGRLKATPISDLASLRTTVYNIHSKDGTPLRKAFYDIGRYFDVDDKGGFAPSPSTPYLSKAEGGSCQQGFAILITDGQYNDDFFGLGNTDNGKPAPYGDTFSDTLSDIASYFYDKDLAKNLPDQLQPNRWDDKCQQHLVTYGISFGIDGIIPLTDMDRDGQPDPQGCNYKDDPYFHNLCTPKPTWPNPKIDSKAKIDDLWHATINGHGQYFNAANPDELVQALKEITRSIQSRLASGSSVALSNETFNDGSVLYQPAYDSGKWTGNIIAYPIDPVAGKILFDQVMWHASEMMTKQTPEQRLIVTSDGENKGILFQYNKLTSLQQAMLDNSSDVVNYLRGQEKTNMRARSGMLGDIVHSAPKLTGKITKASTTNKIDDDGDGTIDEPGESVGGTLFAGSNDGMLHAFNAQTGEERFAYIPHLVFDHLTELTRTDTGHRYFIDGSPVTAQLIFAAGDRSKDWIDNDGDGQIDEADENYSNNRDDDDDSEIDEPLEKNSVTLLVGGLGRGGRGYYALDVTEADKVTSKSAPETVLSMIKWEYPQRHFDGRDNDQDGQVDEADEAAGLTNAYEFAGDQRPRSGNDYSDQRDNNGDGIIDEPGEMAVFVIKDGIDNDNDGIIDEKDERTLAFRDDDLGYTYSTPAIIRTYRSLNPVSMTDHPYVVLFGNGYDSVNGHAVLYLLNALSGELIRKIDTGAGGDNGLSTPVAVDVDDDLRVDFVYAGDLKGNLWKFDIRSSNPADWRVAHKDKLSMPQPMFSVPGQPIIGQPDVCCHPTGQGYLVFFGTGKFFGTSDQKDHSQQTVFGIWDYGDPADPHAYPGRWDRNSNNLNNLSGVKLQQQWLTMEGYNNDGLYLRAISSHAPHWYLVEDGNGSKHPASIAAYNNDGIDNDGDGMKDETSECDDHSGDTCLGHLDPGTTESTGHAGWFFELPGVGSIDGLDNDGDKEIDEPDEQTSDAGERAYRNMILRGDKLIYLTTIPDSRPCSGGGFSIIHIVSAFTGGSYSKVVIDITSDDKLDQEDTLNKGNQHLVPASIGLNGIYNNPVFLTSDEGTDRMIMNGQDNDLLSNRILGERLGLQAWREIGN